MYLAREIAVGVYSSCGRDISYRIEYRHRLYKERENVMYLITSCRFMASFRSIKRLTQLTPVSQINPTVFHLNQTLLVRLALFSPDLKKHFFPLPIFFRINVFFMNDNSLQKSQFAPVVVFFVFKPMFVLLFQTSRYKTHAERPWSFRSGTS